MATPPKLAKVDAVSMLSSCPPVTSAISVERHYSPAEIGELWNLSADCVRKTFENEPGVLVIGNTQPRRGKRAYTTLRIPQLVLDRVHRRLSKV